MFVDGFIHLDELAEEDKFFLIQELEDLNKNIRYTCKQQDIFCDDDDESHQDENEDKEEQDSDDGGYAEGRGGGKRYTRPSVRGVRGARKLDIILDEEEDGDADENAEVDRNENYESAVDPIAAITVASPQATGTRQSMRTTNEISRMVIENR